MKRFAVAALALVLTACGASTPAPKLTPPKPAIVALAGTPPLAAEAPKATTRTISHPKWEITVPSGWTVSDEDDTGVKVTREKAPGVIPAMVEVASQDAGESDPEEVAMMVSVMAEASARQNGTVTGVQRKLINFHGNVASLTQVNTQEHVFIGALGLKQASTNTAFMVICIAPANEDDASLMATITKTFTLHEAPAAAPTVAPKKTSFQL